MLVLDFAFRECRGYLGRHAKVNFSRGAMNDVHKGNASSLKSPELLFLESRLFVRHQQYSRASSVTRTPALLVHSPFLACVCKLRDLHHQTIYPPFLSHTSHLSSPTTLLLAQLAINMNALADDLALRSMFAALYFTSLAHFSSFFIQTTPLTYSSVMPEKKELTLAQSM